MEAQPLTLSSRLSRRAVEAKPRDLLCAPVPAQRSPPLVLPQNRHPERSASQTFRLTVDLRRGVEGPRGCLTNECSAGLSGHQNQEKIKKVTTSERSRAAVRLAVKQRPQSPICFATALRVSCLGQTNRLVKTCELTGMALSLPEELLFQLESRRDETPRCTQAWVNTWQRTVTSRIEGSRIYPDSHGI